MLLPIDLVEVIMSATLAIVGVIMWRTVTMAEDDGKSKSLGRLRTGAAVGAGIAGVLGVALLGSGISIARKTRWRGQSGRYISVTPTFNGLVFSGRF